MEWLSQCTYWSELLPGAAWQPGIGRRSHNRERVSWVSWDCAPAHGTGLFSGRFAPHLPPFALYLFLVQFDCLVKVHTSSSSFLFWGGVFFPWSCFLAKFFTSVPKNNSVWTLKGTKDFLGKEKIKWRGGVGDKVLIISQYIPRGLAKKKKKKKPLSSSILVFSWVFL